MSTLQEKKSLPGWKIEKQMVKTLSETDNLITKYEKESTEELSDIEVKRKNYKKRTLKRISKT